MEKERITPNSYQLYILQCIMRIEAKKLKKKKLKTKDYEDIASALTSNDKNGNPDENINPDIKNKISLESVKKFFGLASRNRALRFNSGSVKTILDKIGYKRWEDFIKDFSPDNEDINGREHIPIAYLHQLSVEWKKKIAIAAERTLRHKIYPKRKLPTIHFENIENLLREEIPRKLEKYLNTKWYAYFYFPMGNPYPQIIRTVIEIKSNPSLVETHAPPNFKRLNNFKGAVRLDKQEEVLLFDMTSSDFRERAVHIKLLIHTISEPPEIALGEYNNIGIGGIGLHSARLIFEYLDSTRAKDATPKVLDAFTPEFNKLPLDLKLYLFDKKDNYRDTQKPVLSFNSLKGLVQEMEDKKYERNRVRLKEKFQVALSAPRYSLDNDELDNCKKQLTIIKNILEKDCLFEVNNYYLDGNENLRIPQSYDFYSNRIDKCEILIAFLFQENVDECISEVSWAADKGIKVHIFTPSNKKFLPRVFHGQAPPPPSHINIYDFSNLEEIAKNFKSVAKKIFEKEIRFYQEQISKKTKE